MMSFNQCVFVGNAGNDPEARKTDEGVSVVKFSLAVNKFSKEKEQPMWLTVRCWRELADQIEKVVHKGSPVLVSGKLDVHKYTDKTNVERTSVEVIAHTVQVLPTGARAKAEAGQPEDQAA
jgi:single-strand DNA-binding protein